MSAIERRWSARVRVTVVLLTMTVAATVFIMLCPVTESSLGADVERNGRSKRVEHKRVDIPTLAELDRQWEEREARLDAERAERERVLMEEMAKLPPLPPKRRVRRWTWKSPAETRAELWNVPEEETQASIETGLLRICISEADGDEDDCIGIWQVLNNIRSRSCNRGYIRLITECDDEGETLLSVMRRASARVLGTVPPTTKRQEWISQLELSCERPSKFYGNQDVWQKQYENRRCPRAVKLVKNLVAGTHDEPLTGVRIIAWGGRCENKRGACDDAIACQRGLVRAPGVDDTHNAFWCRPGAPGCPDDVEPACRRYMRLDEGEEHPALVQVDEIETPAKALTPTSEVQL